VVPRDPGRDRDRLPRGAAARTAAAGAVGLLRQHRHVAHGTRRPPPQPPHLRHRDGIRLRGRHPIGLATGSRGAARDQPPAGLRHRAAAAAASGIRRGAARRLRTPGFHRRPALLGVRHPAALHDGRCRSRGGIRRHAVPRHHLGRWLPLAGSSIRGRSHHARCLVVDGLPAHHDPSRGTVSHRRRGPVLGAGTR
jgi:hypothetical protein